MAGHARYTALLDACVLYPVALSDALMSLAVTGLFAAKWTQAIEDEWIRNLEQHRPELTGRLDIRRDMMRSVVPDWEVQEKAWQAIASSLTLPDKDDVHVLAAAIAGHADCIVTANLKDFPADTVNLFGIEVIHPDDFILKQLDLDPFSALAAFKGDAGQVEAPAGHARGIRPCDGEEWPGGHSRAASASAAAAVVGQRSFQKLAATLQQT